MAADLPLVASAADQVVDAAKEQAAKIKADPILWVSNLLIKGGAILFLLGIGAYFISVADRRAAQGFITDIDNTLGIGQETPPTPPRKVPPAPVPPPPPSPPPQVTLLNAIVADINTLGTTSASANVALLQDVLAKLLSICNLVWGGYPATQTPSAGLGQQLDVAVMQTCNLIYQLEGRPVPDDPEWTWEYWDAATTAAYPLHNKFFSGIIAEASAPFSQVGVADWHDAISETSTNSTGTPWTYKVTINTLAQLLNTTQPFTITSTPSPNAWGALGSVVSDLSGIGVELAQTTLTVDTDVVKAVLGFGQDVAGVFQDIGQGLAMIGKAIVNLPRLLWDSLGYAGSWAGEMIADAVYTPLLIAGAAMFIAGSVLRYVKINIWPRFESRLALASQARVARIWEWLDAKLGTKENVGDVWGLKTTDAMIEAAAVEPVYTRSTTVLPSVKVPLPGTRIKTRILKPGETEPESPPVPEKGTEPPPPEETPSEPAPEVSAPVSVPLEGPPAAPEVGPTSDKQGGVPGGATTAETEAFLGENPTRAPEIVPGERPPLPEPPAPNPSLGWGPQPASAPIPEPVPSYAQRKEEREHEKAERLLAMGADDQWGPIPPSKLKLSGEEMEAAAAVAKGGRREQILGAAFEKQAKEQEADKRERVRKGEATPEEMEEEYYRLKGKKPVKQPSMTRTRIMEGE